MPFGYAPANRMICYHRVTVVMHTMEDVGTTYLVKSNFTSVQIAIWSKEVRFRRTAAADQ